MDLTLWHCTDFDIVALKLTNTNALNTRFVTNLHISLEMETHAQSV